MYILTWKRASRHNGVHFFDIATSKSAPKLKCFSRFDFETCFAPQRRAISHLSSDQLAPHRLLFDPPEPQIIGKTQCVPTFFYLCTHLPLIFFLLVLYSLTLPTSAFFSSVHIVGSLTSKLPSANIAPYLSVSLFPKTMFSWLLKLNKF